MGMMAKSLILLLIVASFIASISLAGYSFTQVQSKEIEGANICEVAGVQLAFPVRIYQNTTQGEVYAQCPWATKNSAVRIVIGFASAIICAILVFTIVKSKTTRAVILAILLLAIGVGFIYVAIIDGMNLEQSKTFCNELDGKCSYKPFIITILLDVLNAVLLVVGAIVLFRFRKNIHHHHHEEEKIIIDGSNGEKIDITTPLVGNDHHHDHHHHASDSI